MKTQNHLSPNQADSLLKKYYDGLTTNEEEQILRIFLASTDAQKEEFNADRAIFGLFAVGRQQRKRPRFVHFYTASIAVAASILLVMGMFWIKKATQPDCVAYINGQRITDKEIVENEMRSTLTDIAQSDAHSVMKVQLQDVFSSDKSVE